MKTDSDTKEALLHVYCVAWLRGLGGKKQLHEDSELIIVRPLTTVGGPGTWAEWASRLASP